MQANHDQARGDISNRHCRHDGTGGSSDTLDPAQNDRADSNHQNATSQRPGNLKLVSQYLGDGVDWTVFANPKPAMLPNKAKAPPNNT